MLSNAPEHLGVAVNHNKGRDTKTESRLDDAVHYVSAWTLENQDAAYTPGVEFTLCKRRQRKSGYKPNLNCPNQYKDGARLSLGRKDLFIKVRLCHPTKSIESRQCDGMKSCKLNE